MLRPAAACALVVLASVALSADAQVQEAQFYFLASVATHRLSLRSAACSAHSVVRMHEAQKVLTHARRCAGQGEADGMKAAVHQAALQKSQHASVGIGASDSDPAQDKERCCTVRK